MSRASPEPAIARGIGSTHALATESHLHRIFYGMLGTPLQSQSQNLIGTVRSMGQVIILVGPVVEWPAREVSIDLYTTMNVY